MIKYKNTNDKFHTALKERVKLYMLNPDKVKVNELMIEKLILLIGSYVLIYFWYLLTMSVIMSSVISCIIGIIHVLMALNFGHENLHQSNANKNELTKVLGLTFVLVGVNPKIWKLLHNFVHHHNTNIDKYDFDIETKGTLILRFTKSQRRNYFTRFQHLYFPLVYSMLTLWWFVYKDSKYLINKRVSIHKIKTGVPEIVEFFAFKFIHLIIYIIVPWIIKQEFFIVILPFLLMHFTQGIIFSLIFQPAHLVEKTKVFYLENDEILDHSWAYHQLLTTCNFGNSNKFLNYLLGGLNFQVEHHLFPKISHVHYKNISQIVKKTTSEFNYPYNEYRSYSTALLSHYKYLRQLAKN